MTITPYRINPSAGLLLGRFRPRRLLMLRDQEGLMGTNEHAGQEHTGAYFAQLATWLEEVCLRLGRANQQEIAKLQRVIDDLLYLYEHYEIKKKK